MLDITYYPFLTCNGFVDSTAQHYATLSWATPKCALEFNGQTLLTHVHGKGWLTYKQDKKRLEYIGHFFTSNKLGYGAITYPTKDKFQGLFRNDVPFGPGVFTQANGSQSRGFWIGDRLWRLSDTCFDDIVPTLAESPAGKKKLQLYYQTLIDLTRPKEDRVRSALKAFHAPPEVEKNIHFLYNYHLRNPGCLTFDRKPYLRAFYGSVDYEIEEELLKPDEEDGDEGTDAVDEPETAGADDEERRRRKKGKGETDKEKKKKKEEKKKKKQPPAPTHLLAWNNSYLIIKIQEHCFKNRRYENFLSTNIRGIIDHVLDIPRPAGDHQTQCYMFLNACASGDAYLANAMIKCYDITPDVSDGCGNTGIFFAAAQDNLDLIDVLSESGAAMDLCNDEGFTALTLCLTRFLAVINRVESWEKAFLPPEYKKLHEGAVILKWPPGKIMRVPKVVEEVSEVPVRKESPKKGRTSKRNTEVVPGHPEFIFNLDPIPPPEDKKQKGKRKSSEGKKDKAKAKEEEAKRLIEEEELKERARVIVKTIISLLRNGANPNYSKVPRPPLILAIYSKDMELVKILLEMEADPNVQTTPTDGALTPLHILALMVPCQETLDMCELLLEYGGNPNVRAKMEYSKDDKRFDFTCGECKCPGKNVLHSLCMRADAQMDKTRLLTTTLQTLVEKGNADCEALYLGNSPLTLAMIRGNVNLAKALLETGKANPNQKLTAKVAVPLGVLLTRSGTDDLPPNDVLEMCNDLLNYGADPLQIIKIEDRFEGNLVELGYDEIDRMIAEEKATKKSGKKEDPVKNYRKLVELVRNGATQCIVNAMQKKMARVLLHAVLESEAMYLPTSLQFAASWLTTEELIEYWIGFINENHLVLDPEDIENVLMSVDLVESESREDQVDEVLEALDFFSDQEGQELPEEPTPELRKEKIRRESKQRNIPSDIDMTVEKYQVCFECGRRVGPDPITCSICNIVKFCSEKCQEQNDKREGLHKCLGWAERLKSMARGGTIEDEFLKKGSRDSKRKSTKWKGKEMGDLERLLRDSEMALKKDSEKKKKKKKSGAGEEEEEGDEKSKLKKKRRKSTAEDGETEEKEGEGKKQKKKKKLEDEEGGKKGKGKKRKGKEEDEKAGGKKGKKGKKESEDRGGKKGRGRGSSVESTDEEGGRKSRRKGETSEEDERKRKSTRHGRREDSARGRGAERVHSERRDTARDRKSTGKFGKYGALGDEDLDRYDDFLLYVSGSAARGMDLNRLLLPYTVLRDGSLYYKLYGSRPLYVENYSHN